MRFFAAFLLLLSVVADIQMDGNVLVLDDDNFDEAVRLHGQMLVEFYAPWCGHCKTLAPEWAKAADALTDSPVKLAKVDATVATGLAKVNEIKGFPTIKYFTKGKPSEYNGGRTEKEIVSWVNKKSGPAHKTVSTQAHLEALKEQNDVTVVGVFESADSINARAFIAFAAESADDTVFALATSEEVRSSLGASHDAIVVLRSFDEPRVDLSLESGFDEKAVASFVIAESTPLIQEFSQQSSKKIFSSPITRHCLVFTSKAADHHASTLALYSEVSKLYKGKVLFINVPSSDETKRVLEYFSLTSADLPTTIMADMNPESGAMKKFPYDGENTVEAISAKLDQFLADELKPSLKSEEVEAADTTGDVVILKGKSFNDLVINNDKDVLVEFYAPWCGHCKQLAPTWDELGKKFKGSNVIIAKMDATANEIDVPGINVKGFPTIYWLRGDKKDSPVKYEGGRELEGFVSYIKEHAHNTVDHSEL